MVQLIWGKNGNMVQLEVLILSAGGATGQRSIVGSWIGAVYGKLYRLISEREGIITIIVRTQKVR